MRKALKSGISFGLTSGVITTLGLMIGLYASTNSKLAVTGGIITIALADAMSDALGMHISKESEKDATKKEIWGATIGTFLSKIIIAPTFLIAIIFLPLMHAIIINIFWGIFLISALSYKIAINRKEKPAHVIFEHLLITSMVIILSDLIGRGIAYLFA